MDRTVQLLTAHVVALAIDPTEDVCNAATEVARVSRGDAAVLFEVHEKVRRLSATHPGPEADRALVIVEGAIERLDSLTRHPSTGSQAPVGSPWMLLRP